jgi:outer membrane protein assembly factor BamB
MRRVLGALALLLLASGVQAADWPTFYHDPARTGSAGDKGLSAGNVARLHLRWRTKLGDVADSAPILVGNRLFVTSKDGTTYAVDAAGGRILWRFRTRGPKITTSVPVYDAGTKSLYAPGVDGYVHELDPSDGRELRGRGFPAQITPAPSTEKDASSLNLANGYLYAETSGYIGDATPYVGHVVAIRLSDGTKHVFNTLCAQRHELIEPQSCPQQRSGMWSRSGVVVDPDPAMQGRIYAATGNGPFDPKAGAYGDSILALSRDASRLVGYYTPPGYDQLESNDLDLGSSSPALLPRQDGSGTPLLMVQGGKDAVLRLLDRAHLGGLGNALQNVRLSGELFGAPAVWRDRGGTTWVAIDLADGVHAYTLRTENRKSRLVAAWSAGVASTAEGTSPVESNGVLFVAGRDALVALDASDGRELWSHAIGPIHWQSPIVADGAVYCSDGDGYLNAFALART